MSSLADKVVEKVVVKRLVDRLHSHGLEEVLQSAYKTGHSIKGALPKVHDDVSRALGRGMGILMLYLDLSAAFDELNIGQLLLTLETSCAVKGTALAWMTSYFTGRSQCTGSAKRCCAMSLSAMGSFKDPFSNQCCFL